MATRIIPKTVLVTGASRGIGSYIAQKFALEGWNVVLSARNVDLLEERKEDLPVSQEQQYHSILPLDLADPNADLNIDFPVDAFISNAGVSKTGLLLKQPREDIEEQLRTNLISPILLSKAVVRNMIRDRKPGNIVFIGSALADRGVAGSAAYSASKGGLQSFARSLAREVGSKGIRVNTVQPGLTETDMSTTANAGLAKQNSVNIGQLIEPRWVAETVYHLVDNPHISGASFTVDAGFSA